MSLTHKALGRTIRIPIIKFGYLKKWWCEIVVEMRLVRRLTSKFCSFKSHVNLSRPILIPCWWHQSAVIRWSFSAPIRGRSRRIALTFSSSISYSKADWSRCFCLSYQAWRLFPNRSQSFCIPIKGCWMLKWFTVWDQTFFGLGFWIAAQPD